MNKTTLKDLLQAEMNDEDSRIFKKFGGNIKEYYQWIRQIESVAPHYRYYYIGGEEVPFTEIYSVLDEMSENGVNK